MAEEDNIDLTTIFCTDWWDQFKPFPLELSVLAPEVTKSYSCFRAPRDEF